MNLEIHRIPADAGAASDLIRDLAVLERDFLVQTLGDDDLADGPEALAVMLANQAHRTKIWLVARRDGEPVGALLAGLPLRDNTSLAEIDLLIAPVGPDHDRVADALWAALQPELRAFGRTIVQCWTTHPLTGPSAAVPRTEWLTPASEVGLVPPSRITEWFTARGFTLEQVERHSVLDLAPALPLAAELAAAAHPHHADSYDLFSWVGETPEEHLDAFASLRARMSVDVPSAGLELEEENWDADRLRADDAVSTARGTLRHVTVARHRGSGELVAYSVLTQPQARPQVAYQDDTLVHGEHRGRRLGMAVKAANLQVLAEHSPSVRRIHTWNAGENQWMLAINEAMGFTERSAEGAWQLTGLS